MLIVEPTDRFISGNQGTLLIRRKLVFANSWYRWVFADSWYDIDDKRVYVLPINKSNRFESTKDGRPWSNVRESKRSNFSGDRYVSTCRRSYKLNMNLILSKA